MDVGDLNEKQQRALVEFKSELGPNIPADHTDRFLIKWLKARNFQVPKSKHMYLKSMEWRRRMRMDSITSWEAPEVLRKYYAGGQMGRDKQGCPVFIDLASYMDFKGLLRSAKMGDIIKYEALQLEESALKMKEYSKQEGRIIDQFTVIMDLGKLGMKQFRKQYMKLYNETIETTEDNYPEHLKQCFIINAPRIFPMVFNLVKPFLTEDTRKKIHVLGNNWKEKVLQHIDADQLPVYWGGTCTDPDGDPHCKSQVCLGGEIPESYYLKERKDVDDVSMTTVTISRKQYHQVDVSVADKGSSIRYQFRSEDHDIGFGVYVTSKDPKGKLSEMTEVMPLEKANTHLVTQDGAVPCDQTGTYVLVFDNRDSWVVSKTVSYNVEILHPDVGTDVDRMIESIKL